MFFCNFYIFCGFLFQNQLTFSIILYNQQEMLKNPAGKLQRLVSELLLNDSYLIALEFGLQNYKIKEYGIMDLKPNFILQTYYEIINKSYILNFPTYAQNWFENELKIYIWLLVGYSFTKKRCISKMTEVDWSYFNEIFLSKNIYFLEYHAMLLIKRQEKHLKWSSDQIQLLKNIKSKIILKNIWNEAAKNLFVESQRKYFRTAKQCRQYWINHLDPSLTKLPWTLNQDLNLIIWTYNQNKKWSKISKLFEGRRTQHMVKNRFNSLYNSQIKKYLPTNKIHSQQQIMLHLKQKLLIQIQQEQKYLQFFKNYNKQQSFQIQDQIKSIQIPNQIERDNQIFKHQLKLIKQNKTMCQKLEEQLQFQQNKVINKNQSQGESESEGKGQERSLNNLIQSNLNNNNKQGTNQYQEDEEQQQHSLINFIRNSGNSELIYKDSFQFQFFKQ